MRTVLIIEDDSGTAEVLTRFLERKGFRAVSVENGLEGLTLIKFLKPAVIIVDLLLPGMDGRQLIRRIRQDIYMRDKMVLVISGTFSRSYCGGKVRGLAADAVFSKPFSLRKIGASIGKFFQRPRRVIPTRPSRT
jgi:DNA-binding response OmpR family regulator